MNAVTEDKLVRLDAVLASSARISIVVHSHPDGDALGSGTAMMNYLRIVRGKDVCLILPDQFPGTLDFLAPKDSLLVASSDPESARSRIAASDLVICQDFNAFSRTGDLEPLLAASGARKVLIDHHLNPSEKDFDIVFSQTEISSASELLFWVLRGLEGGISALPVEVLRPLMTGMTTDTNNFANSVFPSTFEMASELLAAGVDRDSILVSLYNSYREARFRAMGEYLSDMMKITDDGVAYVVMSAEAMERLDLRDGETEGFVNLPLGIDRVKMSIFIREDEGHYRVSVRSKKGWSANRLAAQYFNGGGHECAAGGKLYFPKDIARKEDAGSYIETVTARFMMNEARPIDN